MKKPIQTVITLCEPEIAPPYDFGFHLNHYVLPPERREGESLCLVTRTDASGLVLVSVRPLGTVEHPALELKLHARNKLTGVDIEKVKTDIVRHFCLAEDLRPFYEMVQRDEVMFASVRMNFGAKDRVALTMFQALINCICAQNTIFKRVYSMLDNLSRLAGDAFDIGESTYFAFPTAQQLGSFSLEEIRACKVGYRDKFIKNISASVADGLVDLDAVRELDVESARRELVKLPAVGPYTADLALITGARRLDVLHMDLFVRETLRQFYFEGKDVSDVELRRWSAERWGPYRALAGFYLTTNTEVWAKSIGREFRLKSGAKI